MNGRYILAIFTLLCHGQFYNVNVVSNDELKIQSCKKTCYTATLRIVLREVQ